MGIHKLSADYIVCYLSKIYRIISKFSRVFLTIITLPPRLILFESIIMYELSHICMANSGLIVT